jgi:hypothetical protein
VGGREGVEWVVREWVWQGGEMNKALYAHKKNKIIKKNKVSHKRRPNINGMIPIFG